MLPNLRRGATADEARAILSAAGWRELGTGDWAWVLASPDDTLAARVTPFDPAFRLFADACLEGPPNRFLVRVDELVPLHHQGYVVVMELLRPATEERAHRLAAALAVRSGPGSVPLGGSAAHLANHPDVLDLRRRIGDLLAEGARRFRFWGGADLKPGNVLQTTDGQLRITDPVFIRGLDIFEAISGGRGDRLVGFSRADLQDFLRIPAFPPGPETEVLRHKVDALVLEGGEVGSS